MVVMRCGFEGDEIGGWMDGERIFGGLIKVLRNGPEEKEGGLMAREGGRMRIIKVQREESVDLNGWMGGWKFWRLRR